MNTLKDLHFRKLAMVFLFCFVIVYACGCKTYSGASFSYERFDIRLDSENKASARRAMVSDWKWSGDPNDNVIEIPDNYSDKVIFMSVGGYIGTGCPAPFEVVLDDSVKAFTDYKNPTLDVGFEENVHAYGVPRDTEYSFEDVEFTIKLGKNVGQVYISYTGRERNPAYTYIGVINEDESITFYRIYFRFECDEENETYYAEDGILYEKKTNSRADKVLGVYKEDD